MLNRLKHCKGPVCHRFLHEITSGVQKVCGSTMKEQRFKGHSMYENITSQYKNIHQEKSVQIHLQFMHAIIEVAYPQTLKN